MLSKLEPEAKVCDMKTEWCRENGTHLSRGNRCSEPRISHTPYFPLRTKAHCAVWIRCGQFISYSAWGLSYCLLLILKLEIFICLFIFTTFSRKICCPPLETWLGVANLVLKWQFSLLAFDVWSMTSVCGNVCLCLFSQNCIATHESNGIDIITALILNDINPLGKKRMDLVLELKASRNWKQKKKTVAFGNFVVCCPCTVTWSLLWNSILKIVVLPWMNDPHCKFWVKGRTSAFPFQIRSWERISVFQLTGHMEWELITQS